MRSWPLRLLLAVVILAHGAVREPPTSKVHTFEDVDVSVLDHGRTQVSFRFGVELEYDSGAKFGSFDDDDCCHTVDLIMTMKNCIINSSG